MGFKQLCSCETVNTISILLIVNRESPQILPEADQVLSYLKKKKIQTESLVTNYKGYALY